MCPSVRPIERAMREPRMAPRGDEALPLVVGSRNEISFRSGALEGDGGMGVGLRFTQKGALQ